MTLDVPEFSDMYTRAIAYARGTDWRPFNSVVLTESNTPIQGI